MEPDLRLEQVYTATLSRPLLYGLDGFHTDQYCTRIDLLRVS